MKNVKRFLATALALCLVIGLLPMSIFAATSTGTTSGEPFPQGTGGSNSFRIPALVTLSDGTLVAAADARWNTTYDGGGLDTIVSVSKDNGDTWNYSFANYLSDNGDQYNGSSTCFIDPALAVTSDDTIYMLVDLYPYGVALNGEKETTPSTTVGFFDDNKLKLSSNSHSSYDYYLNLTDYKIYSYSGDTEVTGYTVDKYFNIKSTDGSVDTNLFFSDSPYKVVRTGFLYLTKSTDQGATWSEPTLLNLKTGNEMVCLVAPGRGLVTSKGMIVFPVYKYNGSQETQQLGFIYSTDNGATWNRSENFTGATWSSESAAVELESGNLRFFYRNGNQVLSYCDYDMTNNTWGSQNTTSISTNSNCQISAITYAKTLGGQQVILVSCPTGPNEAGSDQSGASYRKNGKIFVFTVNSDGVGMTSRGSIAVTSNDAQFMYSCLTELSDGTVGILYEDCESSWGTGTNCYYTMSYAEYDLADKLSLTFDEDEDEEETTDPTEPEETTPTEPETNGDVTVSDEGLTITGVEKVTDVAGLTDFVAYDVTLTKNGESYTDEATVTIALNSKFAADVELWGFVVESDGTITYIEETTRNLENDTLTFTAPHFSTVGATPAQTDAVDDTTVQDTVSGSTVTTTVTSWKPATSITAGGEYIIVNTSSDGIGYALVNNNGSVESVSVTIADGKITHVGGVAITDDNVANILWTISGSSTGTIKNGDHYVYLNYNNNNASLSLSTSNRTLNITDQGNGAYRIYYTANKGSAYLRYSNNNWSATTKIQNANVYLFEKTTATETVGGYTVDAALQESRIGALTVTNDNYTDDSWSAYQSALTAAQSKLTEVEAAAYTSEDAANAALEELIEAVDALENAKNALVKAVTININYQANGSTVATGTLNVAANATSAALPSTVVGNDGNTYTVDNTTLTLTGATSYNVAVTELEGTPISIKENETKEISVTLEDGQYVQWSTADSSYVGVAGKYDASESAYTNTAVIVGYNVTDSTVLVTGNVYNEDGTKAGTYKWLVTVTEGDADTNTTKKHIYVNVKTIENCTVYYSVNAGELIKINGTGVLVDEDVTGHYNLMFFAAPDEGYALTYMAVSGSGNQYYTLSNGNPDGTGSDAWPFGSATQTTIPADSDSSAWKTINGSLHGFRWALMEGNFGIDQMKAMFSQAIALGCDGATTFTKNSTESFYTEVGFVAQKLPTMDKTIVSITHSDGETEEYQAGMELGIGDTINYKITITIPAELQGDTLNTSVGYTVTSPITTYNKPSYTIGSFGTVTLTNGVLTDVLTEHKFYTDSNFTTSFNGTLTDTTTSTTERTLTYYTRITLGASNFLSLVKDGKITNEAGLSFDYTSNYATGTLKETSQAVAEILVEVPEYVIDFGAPVEIDLTNDLLVENDVITKAVANYGTVEITGDRKILYTPNQIMQGTDFITLTFQENETQAIIGYGVRIYPATTIYYEEGFITWGDGWTGAGKPSANQTAEELGEKTNNYGYDSIYANNAANSNSTVATATAGGASGTFTFTGTGLDLYAGSTPDSGYVLVKVTNANGAVVKLYTVNTVAENGSSNATAGQKTTLYGLPIVSLNGLAYGTYTVTITKIMDATKPVYIDGVRIYGTIEDSTIFTSDLEDDPEFYELRDYVLNAMSVGNSDIYGSIAEMADQVYAGIGTDDEKPTAVILANGTYDGSVQDLLDNGPKNELYLHAGETLAFSVKTSRVMQIGLKSPAGSTTYSISYKVGDVTTSVASNTSMNSSVDMFYSLGNTTGTETTYTITITNNGSNILSVTDLKICDDPNFSFEALTAEDIELALNAMGYEDETEEEEVPEETVPEETEPEETKPAKPAKPGKDKNDRDSKNDLKDFFEYVFGKIKSFFGFKR